MTQDTEASTFREQFRKYKQSAIRRSLSFELSLDDFKIIVKNKCHYCGSEPSLRPLCSKSLRGAIMNGIDRFDNSIGYTLENSVPCCTSCNYLKGKLHANDFISKIKKIYTEVTNNEN